MTETERILDQLHRTFEGDAWHGPSVVQILEGITAQQAAAHPVPNAHSIWELVLHIGAWETAGTRRLGGDPAKLSDEEDWPSVSKPSEAAWTQTIEKLRSGHNEFRDAIAKLVDSTLDGPVVESEATVYGTVHGIIQHTLYHAGQIAILKKATEGAKQ